MEITKQNPFSLYDFLGYFCSQGLLYSIRYILFEII